MAAATNAQVQNFVDRRLRVRCAQIRSLLLSMHDDKSAIDDVYANVSASGPASDWTDNRGNADHLMSPSDVLAINGTLTRLIAAIEGDADIAIALKCCLDPV